MAEFNLTAQQRNIVGKKVGRLRREGIVPGTIYGPKTPPVNVQFVYRDVEVALMNAGGTNVVQIAVDDDKIYATLARDVQRDVIRGSILHVDFFAVDMDTKIRAEIPIEMINQSPLVEARKAILITGPNSLTVEMLPSRLMDRITIDLAELEEMGDAVAVKDLQLGDATIINDPEEMIAKVVQPSAARAAERLAILEGEPVEEGEMPEGEEGEEGEEEGEGEEL